MPFTWFVVFLLWTAMTKNPLRKKRTFVAAIVVLFLFSNRIVFDEVMRAWEIEAIQEPAQATYDGIIVLGGTSYFDEQLNRVQFSRGADRLIQGLLLLKKGVAPKLVFTGGSGSILYPQYREAVWIAQTLKRVNIPDSMLIFEDRSRNTYENALYTKSLLGDTRNKHYLLITSGFHMRRSLACFAKVGLKVIPYSTDRYSGGSRHFELSSLLPDVQVMQDWNQIFHEWFGCITYKIAGYI